MVTTPFKIGPFDMSLRLAKKRNETVLMGLVPGARDQDSAGLRPTGGWPDVNKPIITVTTGAASQDTQPEVPEMAWAFIYRA